MPRAFARNVELEYERNGERYRFLRWGQSAFDNFRVVPPGTGICHQVNLEYLVADRVDRRARTAATVAYPDTLVGTDSHTTMVNGLAVLGWGVGGIEAEAAMLGQPISMLHPRGHRLPPDRPAARGRHRHRPGAHRHRRCCARRAWSASSSSSSAPASTTCRWRIARPSATWRRNTAPPAASSRSTRETHPLSQRHRPRPDARRAGRGLCQGAGHVPRRPTRPIRSSPTRWRSTSPRSSRRSPARSARRTASLLCRSAKAALRRPRSTSRRSTSDERGRPSAVHGRQGDGNYELGHGDVVIAAITSCTNTSNPSVHDRRRPARAERPSSKGLTTKPWVKTSLAPGSRWSPNISPRPACRTISTRSASTSSATAAPPASAIPGRCRSRSPRRSARATWSSPRCCPATATSRAASIPMCAPTISPRRRWSSPMRWPARCSIDLTTEPLGTGTDGKPVYLKDIWPSSKEIAEIVRANISARDVPHAATPTSSRATSSGRRSRSSGGQTYNWDARLDLRAEPALLRGHAR